MKGFGETIYRTSTLLLGAFLVVGSLWFIGGPIREYRELQARQARMEDQLRARQEFVQSLRRQQLALQNDPAAVERFARERFGLALPGETVVKFHSDTRGSAPP